MTEDEPMSQDIEESEEDEFESNNKGNESKPPVLKKPRLEEGNSNKEEPKEKDEFESDNEEIDSTPVAAKEPELEVEGNIEEGPGEDDYDSIKHYREMTDPWNGTGQIDDEPILSSSDSWLANNRVLFSLSSIRRDCVPKPFAGSPPDTTWSGAPANQYVFSPFAAIPALRGQVDRPRFELVQEALNSMKHGVHNLDHVRDCIGTYTKINELRALDKIWKEMQTDKERVELKRLLSSIAQLALELPQVVPTRIPLLSATSRYKSISMSQYQAACLLANMFYCTFDRRYVHDKYNAFSWKRIHAGAHPVYVEKMKFILAYFQKVTAEMPCGTISYMRRRVEKQETDDWIRCQDQLSDLYVSAEGTIESASGCLQVDFANEYIGGGVFGEGAVQEEIRFLICPELLVSCLLCEKMDERTAIVVVGAQRFSSYEGYGSSVKHTVWDGPEETRDRFGRVLTCIVAIDAFEFKAQGSRAQFSESKILRELNKAYVGFYSSREKDRPVATGNWGCGAFNGDLRLKSIIQLLAASRCHRDVAYFTFGSAEFTRQLRWIHGLLREKHVTVGVLTGWLLHGKTTDVFRTIFDKCAALSR